MNIDDVFASEYLSAADLAEDTAITVTIARVTELEEYQKLLIEFDNASKSLVCNKTNARTIAKAYGPETDNWIGKKLTLFRDSVWMNGEEKPCIRVKCPKAKGMRIEPINEAEDNGPPF